MASTELQKKTENRQRDPVILAHEFSKTLKFEKLPYTRFTGAHYLEQSKYVSVRFSATDVRKWGTLELIHITDMQFGHVRCNVKKVTEYRDWVLSKPNRFILWGGDNVDAWRLGSPGSPYENMAGPDVQVREFAHLWAPAAHRVLGYVGGNHERRAAIGFGDLGSLISQLLGIPYSAGQQSIDIHFGDWKPYRVNLWHGRGAARSPGGKINMLYEFMLSSDAHLCLVGHLHSSISAHRWRRISDSANLKPTFERQGGAMSSSFLEWIGSYAEVAGMPMTGCLMAAAILKPNRKWTLLSGGLDEIE